MKEESEKYFMVIAKCGHVGRKHYIPIKFAIISNSAKEAAKSVRYFPRVKHNHKDAILYTKQISYEEYLEIMENNHKDPYLQCRSRHEQNQKVDLKDRLEVDPHNVKITFDKKKRKDRVVYKLKKNKVIEESHEKELNCYAY